MSEIEDEFDEHNIETPEDYQRQSEINDLRQHANKIINGIKQLDQHDMNRAIWELFQNAVDLSSDSHITIELSDQWLKFGHNGEPFTPMTLDCLFKQVSSKTLEEKKEVYEDEDPLGQYGSGFLTSHVFGKDLTINGAIKKKDGYIPLNDFKINRHTDNWRVLAAAIRDLKVMVTQLLEAYKDPLQGSIPETTFRFEFSNEYNRKAAERAINSLDLILPYVMALNPKLSSVRVISGGQTVEYSKEKFEVKNGMSIRPIKIGEEVREICCIESEDKKITVILPVNSDLQAKQLDDALPRLFLVYPLVGTESLGINFVIHSRQFQPLEPRNGLYLKSENEANTKDELRNRTLMATASDLIFSFLNENAKSIINPAFLATINFNVESDEPILNDYFQELKATWIQNFKGFPLVETENGNIVCETADFLDKELLLSQESFESSYALALKFWATIPIKGLIEKWTEIVDQWGLEKNKYIFADDILEKVELLANLEQVEDHEALKSFYSFLLHEGRMEPFNQRRLLPNIKGEFRTFSGNEGLNNPVNIGAELIEIADVIMPEATKRHVHDGFKFNLEFSDYSRRNYSTEILALIGKQVTEKTCSSELDEGFLSKFVDYCKLSTTEDSNSAPARMMKLCARYYGFNEELIQLIPVKDDELEIRSAQRRLIRMVLNDVSLHDSEWVVGNIKFLHEFLSVGSGYAEYDEIFMPSSVYPSQLNELSKQSGLSIDGQIPDDIKNLYDRVVKPSMPIRASLILPEFGAFLKHKQTKSPRDLTERIEDIFFNDESADNFKDHSYKKEIMAIIDEFRRSSEYIKYYQLIYSKRSSLLVELADGEDTFAILSLKTDTIKELATLAQEHNLEQILSLGREALLKKQREAADDAYMYAIGTYIEKVMREGLSGLLSGTIKADFKNVQDGQDIIIKSGETPIYYIEVKSRWHSEHPVRMSKNQTIRADEKKDRYALCTVDMTKFTGPDPFKVKEIDEIENCIWFNINIGHEVFHLIDVLKQEKVPDTIHLDGDYRTLVPMTFVESGIRLKSFENYIVGLFKPNEEVTVQG